MAESGNALHCKWSISRFESEQDLFVPMVDHTPDPDESASEEANFYPVDGIRGHCKCGEYFHYISMEGETRCTSCGRVWNIYVDHDLWEEPDE